MSDLAYDAGYDAGPILLDPVNSPGPGEGVGEGPTKGPASLLPAMTARPSHSLLSMPGQLADIIAAA
jgi:hypothetical protein